MPCPPARRDPGDKEMTKVNEVVVVVLVVKVVMVVLVVLILCGPLNLSD